VTLSTEEAAERYLGIVCQRNIVINHVVDALNAQIAVYNEGGSPDMTATQAAATEALRVGRVTVELLDDDYYAWPGTVATEFQALRTEILADAGALNGWAHTTEFLEAMAIEWAEPDAGTVAAQEIRYQLDLPPDTTTSCVGLESKADELHAAMTERREYLVAFTEPD